MPADSSILPTPALARRTSAGRAARAAVAGLAVALGFSGCESKPPPQETRATAISSSAPEPFQAMRLLLTRLGRFRDAGDAASARTQYPEVLRECRSLFLMTPPADLKRENVARFLDARAQFTDALNAYGRAVAGTDDAALWSASRELDAAFWAWFDAYRGRPSEGAV